MMGSSAPSLPLVTQPQRRNVSSQFWESACFKWVQQSFINAPFMLIFFIQAVTITQQLLQMWCIQVDRKKKKKKKVGYIKPGSLKLCEMRLLPPQGAASSHIDILNLSSSLRSRNSGSVPGCGGVVSAPPGPQGCVVTSTTLCSS